MCGVPGALLDFVSALSSSSKEDEYQYLTTSIRDLNGIIVVFATFHSHQDVGGTETSNGREL